MDTIRMAMYEGTKFIDQYDVPLDDEISKHIDWFIGAVSDEGGTRVRITQRAEDDGKVKNEWMIKVDEFFEQNLDDLKEELVEERLMAELEDASDF